ncbi:unnamed protein product [Tuber melanosporum]|uniref:(Perigord truffle) hypothetical protein n=1 Tax=Tuber melanosporum (strain Mel28) TaxID=656061 RepID=D5GJ46_TUBMM|nr:uncharacterized protein GSTUM_00008835001 [Tuber melanosporum]CAZ84539.1 unnamed protein product [Tuber melanosporum]
MIPINREEYPEWHTARQATLLENPCRAFSRFWKELLRRHKISTQ